MIGSNLSKNVIEDVFFNLSIDLTFLNTILPYNGCYLRFQQY